MFLLTTEFSILDFHLLKKLNIQVFQNLKHSSLFSHKHMHSSKSLFIYVKSSHKHPSKQKTGQRGFQQRNYPGLSGDNRTLFTRIKMTASVQTWICLTVLTFLTIQQHRTVY